MRPRIAWVSIVLILGFTLSSFAATERHDDERMADFFKRNGRSWVVRWSPEGSRVASLVGAGTAPYPGKPAEAARRFLTEWAELFGLKADLSDLSVIREGTHLGGPAVEWQQRVEGLPVDNGRVQVNFDRQGRVLQVVNTYTPVPNPPPPATLTPQQAIDRAVEEYLRVVTEYPSESSRNPRNPQKSRYIPREEMKVKAAPVSHAVLFIADGRVVRAYQVSIETSVPLGAADIVVDATTGRALRIRNRIHGVDGTGQVFLPNPVNSLGDNTLTDASVIPTTNPNPYFTVPLLALEAPAGGPYTLQGPFVQLADIEPPSNTPPSEASPFFVYLRGDPHFDDTMIYSTIDRMQRYIQSLGFIDADNRQVRADSNGADSNSHYMNLPAGQGYIAYASNGVDAGEDGDIIAHEYGHSIQANQTVDKYDTPGEPAAMGEGFGDYWAVTTFYPETFARGGDLPCVGEWRWGSNSDHCLRRTDGNKTTDDVVGEPHADGEIWSRALWDIFNALGRTTADRLILQSHFNVPDAPTFKEGADAILTADLQLYAGSHLAQLCQPFIDRKIYTAADCPTVPASTGTQSTLVVLARFNDPGLPSAPLGAAEVTARVNSINEYLNAVTYSQASLGVPTVLGWLDLGNSRAHYYDETAHNLLVDLVEDVIAHAPAGTDFTAVDRMIILTNDDAIGETRGDQEWATTGPWPYTLPAAFGTRLMSVSIHRFNHTDAQFNHAIGHHFRLIDLYPHPGVSFPRRYVNGWTNMGQNAAGTAFPNTQVFAWEKGRPGWLADTDVQFVPRPDPAAPVDQTFPLFAAESHAASPIAIQVGLTHGIAARPQERVSYYIEARKKTGVPFDSNLPEDGVVVYYVNEWIGQGFGPARIVDATPDDDDLSNAALKPGGVTTISNIDGSGLTVEVLPPTGSEDYRVHLTYAPPSDQVDVWIQPHDSAWRSPNIWIDSPGCNSGTCGFDLDGGRAEVDRGDAPIAGQVNRAYARIYNYGPGTAHDVRVDFYFSDPYHGIDGGDVDPDTGGNTAFNKHRFVVIPDLPPTDSGLPVYVEWTPEMPADADHPHACVKVKIAQVTGDIDSYNQASQENIDSYDITSHSPYPPVIDAFRVVNPYDHPILVYLRPDNVPVGWTATIAPSKAFLAVGASVQAAMTIQAPLSYPVCTSERITATAWYPAGDTLVPLGGSTAEVHLKKSTKVSTTTKYGGCGGDQAGSAVAQKGRNCGIEVQGCTNPPRPYEHITVRYTAPDGSTVYHDVVTDANGCFEDFHVVPEGGPWSTEVDYPGDDCTASTHGKPTGVFVPPGAGAGLPGTGLPGKGPFWYSLHLGLGFPLGSFAGKVDPGPSLTWDLEYPVKDQLSLVALLGYHAFADRSSGPDVKVASLSFDLKLYFPAGSLTGFAEIGPGLYQSGGSTSAGANLGLGLHFPLLPNLGLEVAADFHEIGGSQRRAFVDTRLGAAWKF